VAAEFQNLDVARLLLDRGADVNAAAMLDEAGVGGQTPIFHAATQREDAGLPLVELLVERGADLTFRAKLPGHYEAAKRATSADNSTELLIGRRSGRANRSYRFNQALFPHNRKLRWVA
jgi:ankyrin repeat protein